MKTTVTAVLCVLTIALIGCRPQGPTGSVSDGPSALGATGALPPPVAREKAAVIGTAVAAQIAEMSATQEGDRGAPIIVIEERHDLRIGQIENAILLTRLHNDYHLKDIGLEGFTRESASTGELAAVQVGTDPTSRARIASQFLREGEVSAPEFMKLVYPDVTVHPLERTSEDKWADKAEKITPILYLFAIAKSALESQPEAAFKTHVAKIKQIEASGSDKASSQVALMEYVINIDPWTAARYAESHKGANKSIEGEIAFVQSITDQAATRGVVVEPELSGKMSSLVEFLKARAAASQTMVDAIASVADRADVAVVAMNIGSGHTAAVSNLLGQAHRPFAVITVRSLKDFAGSDMSLDMVHRKEKGVTIRGNLLGDILSGKNHKFPPVVQTEWFQTKSTLYSYTDRIVARLATGGAPPGGGKPPPADTVAAVFPDPDEFKDKSIYVDPKRIKVVADPGDPRHRQAVVFPVELYRDDPSRARTIWVKAARVREAEPENQSVEEMLLKTRENMMKEANEDGAITKKSEKDAEHETTDEKKATARAREAAGKKLDAEAHSSRIQVSVDTKAVIAAAESDVQDARLRY